MVSLYDVIVTLILLFPWSLVLTVAVGAFWTKTSSRGRLRFVGGVPREGRV